MAIHFGEGLRSVRYTVEFPGVTKHADVQIVPGGTALDVMIAAADKDSSFNFKSTYYGNSGYFIDSIDKTSNEKPCYWSFYYEIPGLPETKSPLGVSSVVIPGNGWHIIMRYE